MSTMTDAQKLTISYLRGLIANGKPYRHVTAAADLGLSRHATTERVNWLIKKGIVQVERRVAGERQMRVSLDGVNWTPWPAVTKRMRTANHAKPSVKNNLSEAEILARRLETERAHADRQKWLARERRDWRRPKRVLDGAEAAVARAYGFRL